MLTKLRKVFIILIFLSLLFIFKNKVIAQSLPLFFDFNSDDITSWSKISGNWSVQNIFGSNRLGSNVITPNSFSEIQIGNYSWSNYEIDIDILPLSGWDKNIAFRATEQRTSVFGLNLPVAYALHMSPTFITMQKFVPGNILEFDSVNTGLQNSVVTHLKIKLVDNNVKVYLNSNSVPIINWSDTSIDPILYGRLSLIVTTGATYPSEVWFDNISITNIPPTSTPTPSPTINPTITPSPSPTTSPTPTPTPLPTNIPTPNPYPLLNVIDLKQYDNRWRNDVYDSAPNWTSDVIIEKWGCALTSASMILNYYGYSILPNSLNNWLKEQPDGYLKNGLVNWIAITRYTKLFSSVSKPVLEYKRFGNDHNSLINELTNLRPTILEVPGHFIVAKGQNESSFLINDPGYSNRPTLEFYSNEFNSLRSFKPSFTDLSYIFLTINSNFDIQVSRPSGKLMEGYTFIDNPILNLEDYSPSGSPIKIFEYPKPDNGTYLLEIRGEGNYNLDVYLYDKEGNLNKNIISGNLESGQKDTYFINIGKNNSFHFQINLKEIQTNIRKMHSRKLINNFAFKILSSEFRTLEKLIRSHKYDIVEALLDYIKLEIKFYTPAAIKPEASQILLNNIDNLLGIFK